MKAASHAEAPGEPDMKLSRQNKADILAACFIAIALPAYYKVKFLLDGQMTVEQLRNPAALFEVVFAFLLASLLLILYRFGSAQIRRIGLPALRRLLPLALVAAGAIVAIAFTRFFFHVVVPWGTEPSFEFDIAVLAVLLPLIVSGVADRIFLEGEARDAEQAALAARFETLKARLSPHFLFNSLNTLADIVEEDPRLAVKFIEEMAAIYRYILEHRDQELVPLSAEIDAIQSLLYLLESRQPGAFEFEFNLAPNTGTLQIVPLALQTVVENALKHNVYSASKPMKLSVYTDKDQLVVENTLNRRSIVPSTATGLESLRKRVAHICQRPVQVTEGDGLFSVRVPLMERAAE
jgi:sensor histidine kinase YesM